VIIIDDISYNIPFIGCEVSADFLDKFAERTADGNLHRELIGVYFNYRLELGMSTDVEEYSRLWQKLTSNKEFHTVTVPDDTGVPYKYVAYFSNIKHSLRKSKDGKNYFKGLTVNFIARRPAR